jgi:hypothetical protein
VTILSVEGDAHRTLDIAREIDTLGPVDPGDTRQLGARQPLELDRFPPR